MSTLIPLFDFENAPNGTKGALAFFEYADTYFPIEITDSNQYVDNKVPSIKYALDYNLEQCQEALTYEQSVKYLTLINENRIQKNSPSYFTG